MTVTFLGTGTSQGVPVIGCPCKVCHSLDFRDKRLRTAAHIAIEGKSFVIDTGPDFRQQMLREKISTLDAILFTHEHKDHTAGLDDIRPFNFRQRRDMPVYGRRQVIEQLKTEFAYAFSEKKYPGTPEIKTQVIENAPFAIDGITIHPVEVHHYKLPVFGYRINGFSYITDASSISPAEKEKIKHSKVLVLNALQKEEHISHFTLSEALALIEELEPEQAYLTHISHRLGLHEEIQQELPESVALAYDGLKITL
ncbi:MBL fold metallo-hydrolase [Nafulsella turpanensis]|uniref:MBL fold metallo-hydrolase n=1 Tax=Nafulsella turpanensis TaxID=1265690 RepID=UPI00034BADB4|nr:MBL fold metallo-hydrolase [Nafulsella turpanensis]